MVYKAKSDQETTTPAPQENEVQKEVEEVTPQPEKDQQSSDEQVDQKTQALVEEGANEILNQDDAVSDQQETSPDYGQTETPTND